MSPSPLWILQPISTDYRKSLSTEGGFLSLYKFSHSQKNIGKRSLFIHKYGV